MFSLKLAPRVIHGPKSRLLSLPLFWKEEIPSMDTWQSTTRRSHGRRWRTKRFDCLVQSNFHTTDFRGTSKKSLYRKNGNIYPTFGLLNWDLKWVSNREMSVIGKFDCIELFTTVCRPMITLYRTTLRDVCWKDMLRQCFSTLTLPHSGNIINGARANALCHIAQIDCSRGGEERGRFIGN